MEIVTVVNNVEQYNQLIVNNVFLKNCKKNSFDNSAENIAITKRYNSYIDESMPDDAWIVFCHQDFEFKEDILPKLNTLDNDCIYGPIGAASKKKFCFYLRMDWEHFKKMRVGFSNRSEFVGEIGELKKGKISKTGNKIDGIKIVDTLDCCCIIVHSSLIRKYTLRFDENLDWHAYSEDFSLNAKTKHNISTKVFSFEAFHYSSGSFNGGFQVAIKYLREKYKNLPFASTCYDGYYYNFINRIKA